MEEKKIKFELSRIGLVFTILFALCLLVWTFILGVWIGTKIGEKTGEKEIALKPERETILPQPHVNETAFSPHNQSIPSNETKALSNQTASVPLPETAKNETSKSEAPKKEAPKGEPSPSKEVKPEKKAPSSKEVKPEYKKKEVAQLASRLKEHGYFIQIGAFSQREKALALKEKAGQLGFHAQIKEISSEDKVLYKVLIGGYESRSEAEKVIPQVREKLGVEKPFIVEL